MLLNRNFIHVFFSFIRETVDNQGNKFARLMKSKLITVSAAWKKCGWKQDERKTYLKFKEDFLFFFCI